MSFPGRRLGTDRERRSWRWLLSILALALLFSSLLLPRKQAVPQQDLPRPKAPTLERSSVAPSHSEPRQRPGERQVRPEATNLLLCGVDGDGYRTDTIMILNLDRKTQTLSLLSLPRDTLIGGDYTVPKLNSAYAVGGIAQLQQEVELLLGFPVDGYGILDLDGFVRLVDAMGGVEFDVPQDMRYDDPVQDLHIDLRAGLQRLTGEQAMELVRYRQYERADIDRIDVQQRFLRALCQQAAAPQNLKNLGSLIRLLRTSIRTDLSSVDLFRLAKDALACDLTEIRSFTPQGHEVLIQDGSYYALDETSLLKIINEAFNPYNMALTKRDLTIRSA